MQQTDRLCNYFRGFVLANTRLRGPFISSIIYRRCCGLVVIVLAIGHRVRGFNSGQGRWIFKGDKNPHVDFLRRGSEAVGSVS
jgi:hypothetical protein